jgi:hypothetical protein
MQSRVGVDSGRPKLDLFEEASVMTSPATAIKTEIRTDNHELGEEMVASFLYQVHLYHWLDTEGHGRFLAADDL